MCVCVSVCVTMNEGVGQCLLYKTKLRVYEISSIDENLLKEEWEKVLYLFLL